MDFLVGSGCSGDEQHDSFLSNYHPPHHDLCTDNDDPNVCNRHTSIQIQLLEGFYREFPQPTDDQKQQLSRDLGLDVQQIQFWFQNKRSQMKAQIDRTDNNVLRAENERIRCENYALQQALTNVICPACGGPSFAQDERAYSLKRLRVQNTHLKLEHERLSKIIANYTAMEGAAAPYPYRMNPQQFGTFGSYSSTDQVAAAAAAGGLLMDSNNLLRESSNTMEAVVEIPPSSTTSVRMETAAAASDALEELYKLLG